MTIANDVLDTAAAYRQLAINKDNSHYAMAERFERRNKILGVPVVVTTAVVSTAIFGSLETAPSVGWKLATGLISVAAAVLAALQTFFNYTDLAQQHKTSARDYSRVRWQLELFQLRQNSAGVTRNEALHDLNGFAQRLDELEAHEPTISDRVYGKTKRRYERNEGP